MRQWMLFLIVGGAIFLAACSSWRGPAEVRLKGETVISCPKGFIFRKDGLYCRQKDGATRIPWNQVAGYATK